MTSKIVNVETDAELMHIKASRRHFLTASSAALLGVGRLLEINASAMADGADGHRPETLQQEIEARLGKPFVHLVWTHRWATFAETSRVAERLGCTVQQYEAMVRQEPWMLQHPPALTLDPMELSGVTAFGGGRRRRLAHDDFVADPRGRTPAAATHTELIADDGHLRLELPLQGTISAGIDRRCR